ncbi:6997_t:CDS:2 [Racocetra fulgida]|uniref:6997_t:CDS:1 n=1 Tax=Racocetra fulgida TaxID=60492 RepID=A0A9N8Z1A1_9GLOM|nr:6997_t:CDS:2 [Racocetra fulgida]
MVNIIKANQREKEIDAARCKVLEQTVLAELALVQAIEKTKDEKEIYDNDSPDHISMPPTVDESLVSDVFAKLESALSHASGQEKESVLYQITSFPKAGETNWRVLEMVDQIMSDWVVLNGGTTAEMRGLIEVSISNSLEIATFQSPKILRYLTFTLNTLGDYDEAELALEAYTALVEKTRETKTAEVFKKIPSAENTHEDKFSGNESIEHVVKVLITVIDPENRPDLHSKSIEALDKSISFDPDAFETHYLLALEYAITRDINKATACVRQAIVLENESIPCWHLLTLLMSSQKDIQGALKACEMFLNETDLENADSSIDDGEEFLSFKLTQNALQELANGPETAIQNHEKLFTLYAKMFPEYTLISPSDLPYDLPSSRKHDDTQTQTAQSPKPATSLRNFPSIIEKKDGDESTDGSISSIGLGNKDTLATKSLVDLWLSSAATFRRLGNLEEAQKAIENAEETDNSNPDFGYLLSIQKQYADAITSFHKALAIDGSHVPTLVHLARTYIETDNIDIAEGLLESVTKGNGKICQDTNRINRAKECLWYALDLEESNPYIEAISFLEYLQNDRLITKEQVENDFMDETGTQACE